MRRQFERGSLLVEDNVKKLCGRKQFVGHIMQIALYCWWNRFVETHTRCSKLEQSENFACKEKEQRKSEKYQFSSTPAKLDSILQNCLLPCFFLLLLQTFCMYCYSLTPNELKGYKPIQCADTKISPFAR